MAKQIKKSNKKKEFWDDREIFTLKDKKLRKVINRIYNILKRGEGLGAYQLTLVYTEEDFSAEWSKIIPSTNSLTMYISRSFYDDATKTFDAHHYGISFSFGESEEKKKSKYVVMNVYEMNEENTAMKVLVSITFNVSNNYYYYTIRDHKAQFTLLSEFIDPSLIFYYTENELLAHFIKVMMKDYDFGSVLDKAEDTYKKVKAAKKAKKDLEKEEKKRKKQEAKEAKKASKKEKKASKDSKEDK